MKQFLSVIFAINLLTGCQLTDAPMWMQVSENATYFPSEQIASTHSANTHQPRQTQQPASVTALYQSPLVDAEIAAAVKDFRLLGYQHNSTTFVTPALPSHYTQSNIEQGCGIRIVPGAASSEAASFDDKQRLSIRDYIERYNRVMLRYCENNAGKSLRVAYRQFN